MKCCKLKDCQQEDAQQANSAGTKRRVRVSFDPILVIAVLFLTRGTRRGVGGGGGSDATPLDGSDWGGEGGWVEGSRPRAYVAE